MSQKALISGRAVFLVRVFGLASGKMISRYGHFNLLGAASVVQDLKAHGVQGLDLKVGKDGTADSEALKQACFTAKEGVMTAFDVLETTSGKCATAEVLEAAEGLPEVTPPAPRIVTPRLVIPPAPPEQKVSATGFTPPAGQSGASPVEILSELTAVAGAGSGALPAKRVRKAPAKAAPKRSRKK